MKVKTTPFLEYCYYYQQEYERQAGRPLVLFELAALAFPDYRYHEPPETREYFKVLAKGGIPDQCMRDHEISCQRLDKRQSQPGLVLIIT